MEPADASEVGQFVETKSFKKMHRNALTSDVVVIDARWVRKWKRMTDGARKVKSRLCARGCFDSQKDALSTRSTTATRLSQRLLMSVSATLLHRTSVWSRGTSRERSSRASLSKKSETFFAQEASRHQ